VEPQEIDSALDELENRLDRLRSLYEQYFMGIEKIEPTVPRKDVDRRFWILRRTQIRNTARRFRLQVLVQRYNTFQQHWTRICREIENGTYVRHLLKAKKNLGAEPKTWAAKKRMGLLRRDRTGSEAPPAEEGAPASADAFSERPSAAPSGFPSVAPPAPAAAAPPGPRPRPSQHADLAPLDLELDDAPTLPPRAAVPRPAIPMPAAAKPAVAPAAAPPPPAVPAPQKPAAPAVPVGAATKPASPAPPRPAVAAPSPAAAAPPQPSALPLPRPAGTTGIPAIPRPRPSVAPRPPAASPVNASPPASPPASPAARAAPAPGPRAPGNSSSLSDERVRQLHEELAAARKQLNQSSNLSVDSLAKSLRDTETKLRAQHGGRSVDFQVVIKDGKPIVKPVVRR
jgi:hypothetical protein